MDSLLDMFLWIIVNIIYSLVCMYMIAYLSPVFMGRKINRYQSDTDIYSTEPHGKILIVSFAIYLIFWIIFRNNFIDKSFDEASWLPIVFYLIMYTFSYLEAQSRKGQKTFLQRVMDNEQVSYNERPNLYNQFTGNCLAIICIAIYDIYLIFTV